MSTVGANKDFKYVTFPDYDAEEQMLKLEAWLYLIWNRQDPTEYLLNLNRE